MHPQGASRCSEDYVGYTYIEATAHLVLRRRVVPPSQHRCHLQAATAHTTATAHGYTMYMPSGTVPLICSRGQGMPLHSP